jgi:predicted peptidase
VLLAHGLAAVAAEADHGFLNRTYKNAGGQEAKYVLFVPQEYKGDKAYPLILFLHGAGESGTDGRKQLQVGLGPAVRKREKTFPFLAVFPQSQKKTWPVDLNNAEQIRDVVATWKADQPEGQRALNILADVEKHYKVDPKRIYLTGISMGGYGTWALAASNPEKWAAIAPVCGGGDPRKAIQMKDLPCWCFHGDADTAVSVERSREMLKALWAVGGHPNYTEYPRVGHNSWDKAYGSEELYEWLLKHQRK